MADGMYKSIERHPWKDVGAWAASRDQEHMTQTLRKCTRQEPENAVMEMARKDASDKKATISSG